MNEAIVERWNSIVSQNDIVFHLGDVMLGDINEAIPYLKALNGKIFIALGNHDSKNRIQAYRNCFHIKDIQVGYRFTSSKKTFILTHYPTITANFDSTVIYSLFGHTHQKSYFYDNRFYMYNVGVDSHNCYPVNLEQIKQDIKNFKNLKGSI